MASFRVSAPGKVILFGEHSVVYGKTAVAASLGIQTSLCFTQLPLQETILRIEMTNLGISKSLPLDQIQDNFLGPDFPRLGIQGHDQVYQRIRDFVETLGYQDQPRKHSLECFFYALVQAMEFDGLKLSPFKLQLDTQLSIGAGSGSSASFAVCLVACFLRWAQLQKDPHTPDKFDCSTLKKISGYSLNCEKIMHGKPSGIDNSVCTFGSVIEFRKPEPPNFIDLGAKSLRVLLVDTRVSRSTKLLVEKFAALSSNFPTIFKDILQVYDQLALQAIDIIKKMHATSENDHDRLSKHYEDLSLLVDINQGLLSTCQVSHETLDTICTTAKNNGFSAKLTGAGGGGFAYVLIPPNSHDAKIQNLIQQLKSLGFSVTETSLGGQGVLIHDIRQHTP